jgi:hypothetical protein
MFPRLGDVDVLRTAALVLALAVTAGVAAADAIPATDGALPIYPRVTFPDRSRYTADLWKSGAYRNLAFLQFATKDDEATVNAWYRSRLPTYTRKTHSDHGRSSEDYEGPGGIVDVVPAAGSRFAKYGKTMIMVVPAVASSRSR